MSRERVFLLDTTLRDGAQTTGVDFSLDDKKQIAGLLDALGIDYVEGGYPGANPLDTEFFKEQADENAHFAAFGMTKRAGRSAANDPGVAALLDSARRRHRLCRQGLGLPGAGGARLHAGGKSRRHRGQRRGGGRAGREVIVDCEHFFDGFKGNKDYAPPCVQAALQGRRPLGRAVRHQRRNLPDEVERIVGEVAARARRPSRHPRP